MLEISLQAWRKYEKLSDACVSSVPDFSKSHFSSMYRILTKRVQKLNEHIEFVSKQL